jgi:hypothetical protein
MKKRKSKKGKIIRDGGFCFLCGSKLINTGRIWNQNAFNVDTGERCEPYEIWKCPKRKWWNRPFVYHELLLRRKNDVSGMGILPFGIL